MRNVNSKIIDKVISSLDWDVILEINGCFKHGIGDGTSAIPGIKRKTWADGITKSDLKNELRCLLKFVIENDINEMAHGYWLIVWNNADWGKEHFAEFKKRVEEGDDLDPEEKMNFVWDGPDSDSTLEVIFSPQRICVVDNTKKETEEEQTDSGKLGEMLEKALKEEKYELASKLKEVIQLQKEFEK